MEFGAQFFDGQFGISATHLRAVVHRYELAFAAVRDIHLYPFSREGGCEGAFHAVLHNHSWVEEGDIVMTWVCHGVPAVRPTWAVVDDDDASIEQS